MANALALVGAHESDKRPFWELEAQKLIANPRYKTAGELFNAARIEGAERLAHYDNFSAPLLADWQRTVKRDSIRVANERLERLRGLLKIGDYLISQTSDQIVNDYSQAKANQVLNLLSQWNKEFDSELERQEQQGNQTKKYIGGQWAQWQKKQSTYDAVCALLPLLQHHSFDDVFGDYLLKRRRYVLAKLFALELFDEMIELEASDFEMERARKDSDGLSKNGFSAVKIANEKIAEMDQAQVGILLRLQDNAWWRRKLRRVAAQRMEQIWRELGFINKARSTYCSEQGREEHQRRGQLNLEMMEHTVLENDDGDQYTLADLAELSTANPAIRRTELMVRIAGFEQYAKELGYVGYFYTITTPSKYHANHVSGHRNRKFEGFSQRDGQQYLCKLWQRFRALAHRETKFKPYKWEFFGFRVAEPHHDGTPHWHLLLFVKPEHADEVSGALRDYAMREDRHEKGAWKSRFKVEKIKTGINPKTGNEYSAAGYIAKYISKNIDGEHIEKDLYGNDAKTSAQSITAWASRNSIRQFQQIGGPSVSAWRELRRIGRFSDEQRAAVAPEILAASDELEKFNNESAADAWQWFCRYGDENGLALWKVAKTIDETLEAIDELTGEIYPVTSQRPAVNRYQEFLDEPHGLTLVKPDGDVIEQKTRIHSWKVVATSKEQAASIRSQRQGEKAERAASIRSQRQGEKAERAAIKEAARDAKLADAAQDLFGFVPEVSANDSTALITAALGERRAEVLAGGVEKRSAATPWTGVNNCTDALGDQPDSAQQILFDPDDYPPVSRNKR